MISWRSVAPQTFDPKAVASLNRPGCACDGLSATRAYLIAHTVDAAYAATRAIAIPESAVDTEEERERHCHGKQDGRSDELERGIRLIAFARERDGCGKRAGEAERQVADGEHRWSSETPGKNGVVRDREERET